MTATIVAPTRSCGCSQAGRLPITGKNLTIIGTDGHEDFERLVEQQSAAADLVICGFTTPRLQEKGPGLFLRHPTMSGVLWVEAQELVLIE